MSVRDNLQPTTQKKGNSCHEGAERYQANHFRPFWSQPLDVRVPKLNENEVLIPGSLVLRFDSNLSGGHPNNFLVQNVSRVLVSQLVAKFGGTTLDDTVDYDIYKIFTDLFLPSEKRENMVAEGIQSEDLCKIRSGSGEKKNPVELTMRKN